MDEILKELKEAHTTVFQILERDKENPSFSPEDRAYDEGYLGALTYVIGLIEKEQQ